MSDSILKNRDYCDCRCGKVERSSVRYGERQRPEHRPKGLLINVQVADAPRTVPLVAPYFSLRRFTSVFIWMRARHVVCQVLCLTQSINLEKVKDQDVTLSAPM